MWSNIALIEAYEALMIVTAVHRGIDPSTSKSGSSATPRRREQDVHPRG
jgi:hypothetical protein